MTTQTLIRMVLGLGLTAVVVLFALKRVWWLFRLIMSGQPVSGRTDNVRPVSQARAARNSGVHLQSLGVLVGRR